MVNLLVTSESLVNLRLNIATRPHDGELLVPLGGLSKSVIFEEISNQPDLDLIVEFEIVTAILRLVGADADWIDVRPEGYVFLPLPIHDRWGLLEKVLDL